MNDGKVRRVVPLTGLLGFAIMATACDIIPGTGPDDFDQYQFFSEVTLPEFEQLITEGSARVEIILTPEVAALSEGGLVAREVEVRGGSALQDEEEIVGRVADLNPDDGYLVLELGDMRVGFNSETAFRKGDAEWGIEQFLGHLTEALALDETTVIKAERAPTDQPQAPDDSTFTAHRISLVGAEHSPQIEVNIDLDNLSINGSPPPDAWVHTLGRMIELRVSDGITKLHSERDDLEKKEFEGNVQSVNIPAGTFELTDGTVVRIVDDTKFAYEMGDKHRLGSLEDVAAALEAGDKVVSAGYGVVEGREPLTIAAMHVVFEIATPPGKEYEGEVDSVDEVAGTVTLSNGTVVEITDETNIKHNPEDDRYLTSLGAVAEAIAAGERVVAWGEGTLVSEEPRTIRADCAVFKLVPPPAEGFEGEVATANATTGVVTLTDGTTILIADDTEIKHEPEDDRYLTSLGAVVEALAAGETVVTWGEGVVESGDPLVIRANHAVFKQLEAIESFENTVATVDVDGGSLTLTDGTVVCITDATQIKYEEGDTNRLQSLQAVADALLAGTTVYTAGEGVVKQREPLKLDALHIVFEI
jgi:hypothetical protein